MGGLLAVVVVGAAWTPMGKAAMAEPPNLMPHRSTYLLVDTKYSKKDTKLRSSVDHTPRKNQKNPHFSIRITNERIRLTSILTISYITF